MPNWCENKMTIRHTDPSMIKRARDAWMSGQFLSEFIPIPNDLKIVSGRVGADDNPEQVLLTAQYRANEEKYGYKDWWDFCISEWSTKWDVGYNKDQENNPYDETQNSFTVNFDSAWAPPTSAFHKLVAMDFDIEAYYHEPGMGFCGSFKDNVDTTYGTGEATKELQEIFNFDVPEVTLTKDQLVSKLLQDDTRGTMDELKSSIEDMSMNGVTGYKDMTEDQLKEEYISRGLHEEE